MATNEDLQLLDQAIEALRALSSTLTGDPNPVGESRCGAVLRIPLKSLKNQKCERLSGHVGRHQTTAVSGNGYTITHSWPS